jgi:amino acid adenylation domain-containing protein
MSAPPRPSFRLTATRRELLDRLLEQQGLPGTAAPLPRRQGEGPAPLSFSQQRLWFLDQWQPGSPTYNLHVAVALAGALDLPALARSLEEVVRRHEILRTRFPAVQGRPVQVPVSSGEVTAQPAVELPRVDLTRLPATAAEGEAMALARAAARRPFDLAAGPPFRAALYRLAAERHLLVLTLHHIVADGWSLGVLVQEVTALYGAFSAGLPSPLPALPIQYADFAVWQRQLSGSTLDGQLAYWRERLAGAPPALGLPTDRPRPAVRRGRGASLPFTLPPNETERLRALGRETDATLFMTLLAAFGALLAHHAGGRERVVVGSPVAGRGRPELHGLIGFFVNTLALSVDLSGMDGTAGRPFADLLARVRETALGAFAHADLPFERLVEELRPERDLGSTPLFEVMLALQNAPLPPRALPGLTVTQWDFDNGTAKFDLLLSLTEEAGGLAGALTYDSDLFYPTTVQRLLDHLGVLLAGIAEPPGRPLAAVPLLAAAERHQLAREWNDTAGAQRAASFPDLFSRQAERTPEAVAVVGGSGGIERWEALTYGELDRRAGRLAGRLRRLGVGPEARVGLCCARGPAAVVALLAVWQSGGAYLPLDPEAPPERLRFLLADAGAALVLTEARLRPRLPDGAPVLVLDDLRDNSGKEEAAPRAPAAGPGNLAYVLYTSGSTGAPKGTLVQHAAVVNLAEGLARAVYRGLGDLRGPLRVSLNAPFTFDASVQQLVQLLSGHTLVFVPAAVRRDGAELLAFLAAERIEVLDCTPSHARLLLAAGIGGRRDLALRRALVGGEALDEATWQRLAELPGWVNVYGPTECTVDDTACPLAGHPRPAIGRPLVNLRVHLLDGALRPVPIGVPGHLHLAGAGLSRGYLGRPELTAERFVPDPFAAAPGERLYRTGDRARLLPEGTIEFLGRLDRQLKWRGYRIEPGEIEAALARQGAVRNAAVVLQGERLAAYVVGEAAALPELRAALAAELPAYMLPSAFVFLDRLPLSAHGKLDLRALPLPHATPASIASIESPASLAPGSPVEEVLAAIWSAVLGVGRIGVEDSFFDLGGHSLLATQVVSRVRESLGVELPVRSLFESPTLSGLARQVEEARERQGGARRPPPPLRPVPRGVDGLEAPLSFAQERLWFLAQLDPESAAYHIPAAVRLGGALDPHRLAAALAAVVARHESLRTRFAVRPEGPVQVVDPAPRPGLPRVDLAALPVARREAEARRQIEREARRPFHLGIGSGPLLRAALFRLGDGEHLLALTLHHIVSDGWSEGVLVRDLAALYRAAPLPPLPVQYADFALWQRGWLQGEALEEQLAYWRERLRGAPQLLELPTDRPRPAILSPRGATLPWAVPGELAGGLRDLARREGASLYMVVLAAFQTLLARSTGSADILVGSPLSGRTHREIEELIGFFVNPVALRADLSGDPSFRTLLGRVRAATLDAYAHQDLPFELLVEALEPRRDPSHTPLFQVVLAFQNARPRIQLDPALTLEPLPVATGTAKYDLTLILDETGDHPGLAGFLEYATALFDGTTARRLLSHLEVLLRGIAAGPERRLADLPLLTGPERAQLLVEWNATRSQYEREAGLAERFAAQAGRTPEAVALVQGAEHWTYRALDREAERVARRLRELGVGPEVRVALVLARSPLAIAAILGVLRAGGAYVPLDPAHPRERLSLLLADSGAAVALTEGHRAPGLPASLPVVCLEELPTLSGEPARIGGELGGDSLATVLYTSGSTGRPKGVMVTHRGIARLVQGTSFAAFADQVFLQLAPLSFDASLLEIWGPLLNGGRLVLLPAHPPALEEIAAAIFGHGITTLWLTAGLFHRLVELPEGRESLGRLRQLLAGGDVLSPPHVAMALAALAEHGGVLIDGYGPTEGTTFTCCQPLRPLESAPERAVPIGRPIANTRAYLLDRHLQPVPLGVTGELYAGGDGLARGYLGRPERTAASFVPHSFPETPGERLYRTGDLARFLPDGRLDFLGRIDGQVKVRGFRVEPGEIEAALVRHPAVAAAAVLAPADLEAPGERRLVAYVVPAAGVEDATPGELRAFLAGLLPAHLVPATFVALPALPLTANGKVDRAALARLAPAARPASAAPGELPRTPAEEILAGIWAEVLGVERVGVEDDFFALGGHSLAAMRVVSRARAALGVELPLRALFAAPTVAGLAAAVERGLLGEERPPAPPLVPVPREAEGRPVKAAEGRPVKEAEGRPVELAPSFAQERLWFLDQLDPGRATYNIPAAFRLQGALAPARLAASLGIVVLRHESLRTSLPAVDGRPVLAIAPAEAPFPLPLVDLAGLPERETELRRLSAAEARRPFDLARGPLLRAALLRLGPREHVLLLTQHHAVSDGASVEVMLRELSAGLEALAVGEPPRLPALPVQYADYAAWQRRWLAGPVLESELGYWRRRLAGAPPVLDLPLDRPRGRRRGGRGGSRPFTLPAGLARSLTALGRQRGSTLFMTLLATLETLLHRHGAGDDLVLGAPVAGRTHREIEGLIGLFVNTLVLRGDLTGDPPFTDLLDRLREGVLEAFAHQEVPFEKLVEELAPERNLSLTPLFQVLFVLQGPRPPLALPGLTVEPLDPAPGEAKLDLTLAVTPAAADGEISGVLDYDADLFDRTTVERLLAHWAVLLSEIAADPTRRLAELPLLSAAESDQLLREWSGAAVPVPAGAADDLRPGLHQLFERQARQTPEAIALTAAAGNLSYGELAARAARLAARLRRAGVGPEVRVGVCLERSPALVVALLAVLAAGGAYVPLDPRYPQARLALLLDDARVATLLTEERWRDALPATGARVLCPETGADIEPGDAALPAALVHPDQLAYLIYTSGSTGQPKGVAIPHRSAVAFLAWVGAAFPPESLRAVLASTSISFDLSIFELFGALSTGGRVVLVEDALALPVAVADGWAAGLTLLNTVPSAAAELVRSGGIPPGIGTVNLAGETPPAGLAEALLEIPGVPGVRRVLNLYGPSETTTYSTVAELRRGDRRPPAIGRPVAGTEVYVVDRDLRPVPAGVPGELLIGGPGLARGYLERPDLTALRFVPHPFALPEAAGARLYRTGDLVRSRGDGELELLGRLDQQVKVRGFRIEPGEIEAALLLHPAVREAAVVVQEEAGDRRLVAYVVSKPAPEAPAPADLRRFLAERLPAFAVPALFVTLAALPRNANGKLDRRALPVPGGRSGLAAAFVPPSGPLEETVAGLFREILRVERAGAEDSFFDLGGHSLLATQLLSRLRRECRVSLSLQTLFESPTVAALAREIARRQEESPIPADADALDEIPRVRDEAELLARLDQLSDEEVAALLEEMSQ